MNGGSPMDRCRTEFWTRLAAGSFAIQGCDNCGEFRFPPADSCPRCGSVEGAWFEPTGPPKLIAWTVSHPGAPGIPSRLADWTPYALGVLGWDDVPGTLVPIRLEPKGPLFDADRLFAGAEVDLDLAAAAEHQLVGRTVTR